jgi:hypothetical protein
MKATNDRKNPAYKRIKPSPAKGSSHLEGQLGILALENAAKSKTSIGGALVEKGLHWVKQTKTPRKND